MTGLSALDRRTCGLHRRRTIYIAARPSMGKTTIAVVIVVNVAKDSRVEMEEIYAACTGECKRQNVPVVSAQDFVDPLKRFRSTCRIRRRSRVARSICLTMSSSRLPRREAQEQDQTVVLRAPATCPRHGPRICSQAP
jgi:replicative DNA helicase